MSYRQLREISAGFRAAAPVGVVPTPRTEPLRCPVCSEPMQTERIRQVAVDACPEHGIWFDRGEVELLVRKTESGERLVTSEAVAAARQEGKISGWWFGLLSLVLDDD